METMSEKINTVTVYFREKKTRGVCGQDRFIFALLGKSIIRLRKDIAY